LAADASSLYDTLLNRFLVLLLHLHLLHRLLLQHLLLVVLLPLLLLLLLLLLPPLPTCGWGGIWGGMGGNLHLHLTLTLLHLHFHLHLQLLLYYFCCFWLFAILG
jgi:hypothetical protein